MANANAVRTELVNMQMVDKEINAETWTQSKKRHELNPWQDYISHETNLPLQLNANFKCPKFQMMSRPVELIRQSGALK